jgi:hypothetical protein
MSDFDEKVVAAAEKIVQEAIDATLSGGAHEAVVGVAPAGAGKSYAIGTAVAAARRKGLRVAVATPTNEQAYALIGSLAARLPRERVVFLPAGGREMSTTPRNVDQKKAKDAGGDQIIIGTLNKLGDAHSRGDLSGFDLLLMDEAYQGNAVHYFGVGDLAPKHLLMGDSGQLAPFSSAPEADRWRGLAEDPLLTAVEVLKRNHPATKEFKLPITRRLDPRAVPVARAFYPGHHFDAAVLPGVRELRLGTAGDKRANAVEDAVLETAAEHGWAHLELPATAVVAADPETIETIVRLIRRLLARSPKTRCENIKRTKALPASEIAVAVSHRDQRSLLRQAFDGAGLEDVVVDTANKLQGLTFEVVVVWHPLAGLPEVDEFHLDPGRLCVMLTRHRHACIVVGRAGDRELVHGIPPATPSYVGWDSNPALDGWYVHEAVFDALGSRRALQRAEKRLGG